MSEISIKSIYRYSWKERKWLLTDRIRFREMTGVEMLRESLRQQRIAWDVNNAFKLSYH